MDAPCGDADAVGVVFGRNVHHVGLALRIKMGEWVHRAGVWLGSKKTKV